MDRELVERWLNAAPAPGSQYDQPAEWYDRIYASIGKDYRAEAEVVDGIVRARMPGAASLLDVACGTGLHLERFAQLYEEVAGIDLDAAFVERARSRCPGVRIAEGDMRSFDLGRTWDVVTCMFSAIGHVGDVDGLDAAIAAMAAHVTPGGVLVVEPWTFPGGWRDGHYGVEIAESPTSTLIRVNHAGSDGNISVVNFGWTEASASGIQRMDEQLRLTRFTDAEYAAAFARAELSATWDPRGCNAGGRGLWIATRDRA